MCQLILLIGNQRKAAMSTNRGVTTFSGVEGKNLPFKAHKTSAVKMQHSFRSQTKRRKFSATSTNFFQTLNRLLTLQRHSITVQLYGRRAVKNANFEPSITRKQWFGSLHPFVFKYPIEVLVLKGVKYLQCPFTIIHL